MDETGSIATEQEMEEIYIPHRTRMTKNEEEEPKTPLSGISFKTKKPDEPISEPVSSIYHHNTYQQFEYKPPTTYYQYKNYEKIPEPCIPKIGRTSEFGVLNLDCIKNKKELIDEWYDSTSVIIQTTPDLLTNLEACYAFIKARLKGNIKNWINQLTEDQQRIYWGEISTEGADLLRRITDMIYQEFLGDNSFLRPNDIETTVKTSNWYLSNIQLCDV